MRRYAYLLGAHSNEGWVSDDTFGSAVRRPASAESGRSSEHNQRVPVHHRAVVPGPELGDQVAGGPAEQPG
jgi:hypothetical protein